MSERRGTALRETIADLQERAPKLRGIITMSETEPEDELMSLQKQEKKNNATMKLLKTVRRGSETYKTARRFQVDESWVALEEVLGQERYFEQLRFAFQRPEG